ncbi:MAG: hypothetical protein QG625_3182 [Cyanobacteriota bacterium erpe_2018_sw_39hr_WHONDRS-SW48-000098_B_bin.30]|nr:hypothetical protein [Cyanobacteriota bacterium erpe_2018_sw_39hr_WHONDRS-SW48-000098_B_bin.30]
MRISKRQTSVLYVVFVLAAGGLVCGAVCNRATVTEQLTDKDVLGWKLEKMFFYSESFEPDFEKSVDPVESRIIDELFADLHAGRFDVVVSKAEPYMRESSHSWNFYFALGAIMIDCKNYRLAQQAFALSERKLTGLIPDAYPSQNFLKRGLNLDPRQALTEAYIHELQDLENDKSPSLAARQALYDKAIKYSHPHGYIYKMYSEFLREQGKAKQADETLRLWDFSPAFREYRSSDIS